MRKAAMSLALAAGALTLACSTMTTAVDYDHTINWSQFHTFQLAGGTKDPETFTQKRIEDGITERAHVQGLAGRHQQPGRPGLLARRPHRREAVERHQHGRRFGYRGWGGWAAAWRRRPRPTFPIGTIVVDMVNPKTNEMFWRGTAQDQVSGTGADKGQVQEAMAAIFKNFPPQ